MGNKQDPLIFAEPGDDQEPQVEKLNPWCIMLVDDEDAIHETTMRVLSDFTFENRPLKFLNAYTGEEAKKLIRENPDTALILLDVVMETDDSGLEVARYIREDLINSFVRIILRTGQPGKAPEKKIIIDYDINDYKAKTELTSQKLFTTVVSALRSYRDLRAIEENMKTIESNLQIIDKNRRGLEQIIESSAKLFEIQSLQQFASGVLTQLLSILQVDESSLYIKAKGFTASLEKGAKAHGEFKIQAATGQYSDYLYHPITEAVSDEVYSHFITAINEKRTIFIEDLFIGYFHTSSGAQYLLYLTGCRDLTDLDKDLILIFCTNVGIAFENINLNHEIIGTQKEVVFTLGEIVENRSKETANHVQRVSEFSYLLAQKYGMHEEMALLLKYAAPLHDIGKIGIQDSILLKPGKLTSEEFRIMKTHTKIGYDILKLSNREILKSAAIVAWEHQEKWDGSGYPRGLSGKDIHIYGRITAIADVFDALSHKRCYKEAWPIDKTVEVMKEQSGIHFDPELLNLFIDNLPEFLEINDKYPDSVH